MNKAITFLLLTGILFSFPSSAIAQSIQSQELQEIKAAHSSSEALLSAAKIEYQKDNYEKVVNLCTEAIGANANNIDAFYYRGVARLELGIAKPSLFTEELLESINIDLLRIMKLDPLNSEVYFYHGRANYFYTRLKLNPSSLLSVSTGINQDIDIRPLLDSISSLKKYLKVSGEVEKEAYLYLADAMIYNRQDETEVNQYLDIYGSNVNITKNANFYLLKGLSGLKYQYIRSLENQDNQTLNNQIGNFSNVISIDPNNEYGYFFRAYAYIQLNDIQSAINDYSQVIKLKPNFELAYRERARIFKSIGDNESATMDERKADIFSP